MFQIIKLTETELKDFMALPECCQSGWKHPTRTVSSLAEIASVMMEIIGKSDSGRENFLVIDTNQPKTDSDEMVTYGFGGKHSCPVVRVSSVLYLGTFIVDGNKIRQI
jgi:hypothetical protein